MSEHRWIRIAAAADCPPGTLLGVEPDGVKIVLANVDGTFYALQDRCSHANYPLSTGELDGTRLTCAYHGACFDVCTGKALQLPAIRPVPAFDVEVRDGDLYVAIP
jgi:nitrite reductase/ring-hydroxylating ferredoxin subunit